MANNPEKIEDDNSADRETKRVENVKENITEMPDKMEGEKSTLPNSNRSREELSR